VDDFAYRLRIDSADKKSNSDSGSGSGRGRGDSSTATEDRKRVLRPVKIKGVPYYMDSTTRELFDYDGLKRDGQLVSVSAK